MRFFEKTRDGGPDSPVTGLFLIEIKSLFSIILLKFGGTRENFHSHAFNALTFWLKGAVMEVIRPANGKVTLLNLRRWTAGDIKFTSRKTMHKVVPDEGAAWALSFRGPWAETWQEHDPVHNLIITLKSPGRQIVKLEPAGSPQLITCEYHGSIPHEKNYDCAGTWRVTNGAQ